MFIYHALHSPSPEQGPVQGDDIAINNFIKKITLVDKDATELSIITK